MSVCVLGSLNLDIVCRLAELPRRGETVMGRGVERSPGGKGANQAAASARFGARTMLIGAVGRDEAGDVLLTAMTRAGVEIDAIVRLEDQPTGQAFIWVSEAGENSIVVVGGANLAVRPDMLGAAPPGGCVLLAQLETPLAVVEALFDRAGRGGCRRLLNAAPAIADGRRLFALTDILILNETELAAYTGGPVVAEDMDAVVALARRLIGRPDQTVLVTLGSAGALAVGATGHTHVRGTPARTIDTTGAGDCFCGVLAARLDVGDDIVGAMRWANAAAAISTERLGAVPSMPSQAEIAARLSA